MTKFFFFEFGDDSPGDQLERFEFARFNFSFLVRKKPNGAENRRFGGDRNAKRAVEVFRSLPRFGQIRFVEDDGASEERFDVGAGASQGARRVEKAIGRESPKGANF